MYDILVIGGGIFGLSAAIELAQRNYKINLLNPNTLPHHLAASTDISKIVRMEYGPDAEYFRMAEQAIAGWKDWNDRLGMEIYHETGFLLLCKEPLKSERQQFEHHSYRQLLARGYPVEKLNATQIGERFPAINPSTYQEAVFNPVAGYAESGLAIEKLAEYARSLGVVIHEGQTVREFITHKRKIQGVQTREGRTFSGEHVLVAAGAHTPILLPELQPFMRATGHPVFWLKPTDPTRFSRPNLPVFAADISNSGWYGFPLHPKYGVVKVARHANGQVLDPDRDDRQVSEQEIRDLRTILAEAFPELANAALVFTRRCLYTDTLDGHFWIDRHPEIEGLSVATGGSGHAFKMGPVLGQMIADRVEGRRHDYSDRYAWRHLDQHTVQQEAARHKSTPGL